MVSHIFTCAICHEDGTFMPFSITHGKKNRFVTLLCSSMCCTRFRELEIAVRCFKNTMHTRKLRLTRQPEQGNLETIRKIERDNFMLPASASWKPHKKST